MKMEKINHSKTKQGVRLALGLLILAMALSMASEIWAGEPRPNSKFVWLELESPFRPFKIWVQKEESSEHPASSRQISVRSGEWLRLEILDDRPSLGGPKIPYEVQGSMGAYTISFTENSLSNNIAKPCKTYGVYHGKPGYEEVFLGEYAGNQGALSLKVQNYLVQEVHEVGPDGPTTISGKGPQKVHGQFFLYVATKFGNYPNPVFPFWDPQASNGVEVFDRFDGVFQDQGDEEDGPLLEEDRGNLDPPKVELPGTGDQEGEKEGSEETPSQRAGEIIDWERVDFSGTPSVSSSSGCTLHGEGGETHGDLDLSLVFGLMALAIFHLYFQKLKTLSKP